MMASATRSRWNRSTSAFTIGISTAGTIYYSAALRIILGLSANELATPEDWTDRTSIRTICHSTGAP